MTGDKKTIPSVKPYGVIEKWIKLEPNGKKIAEFECWVRDTHTEAEYEVMLHLTKLLEDLKIETPIKLPQQMMRKIKVDNEEEKPFFNILYRCDFKIPENTSGPKGENTTTVFEPETPSNCDIVLPVERKENDKTGKNTTKKKYILGLDPLSLHHEDGEKNEKKRENIQWGNNHLTGKCIDASFANERYSITIPSDQLTWKNAEKLYAGVLHGAKGEPATKTQAETWLQELKQTKCNETAIVMFVLIMDEVDPKWYGIYKYNNAENLDWKPVNTLAEQDDFWRAMQETGKAKNNDSGLDGLNNLFKQ